MWCYPHPDCPDHNHGYCHSYHNPFESQIHCGWDKVSMKHGLPTKKMLDSVVSVSICISPNWLYDKKHEFLDIIKSFGLITKNNVTYLGKVDTDSVIRNIDTEIVNKII